MFCRISKHGEERMNQRGFRKRDLDLLLRYGHGCRDGVLLDKQATNQAVRQLKREISDLERLSGTFLVLQGGEVTTLYRASKGKRRKQLDA